MDDKVFIRGRVSTEEEKNGKLICEKIYSFDETKKELWLQFETKTDYEDKEEKLFQMMKNSDGSDSVVIYISGAKLIKRLPPSQNIGVSSEIVNNLTNFLGENNVKVVEKSIEKQ